jgi:hypothetical protein
MMEDPALFVIGLFVTLAVAGALGFIVWAAIQDGDRQSASETERIPHGPAPESAGADPIADPLPAATRL